MQTPAGLLIFSFVNNGVTISEAGVLAVQESHAFRFYVETNGPLQGEPGYVQSGFAISNSSSLPASVRLELLGLDGTATGFAATKIVPPMGQLALFLNEIPAFQSLRNPFRGFLRVTGPAVAVTGLRARYNERRDFLFTSTPAGAEGAAASAGELVFPHFADGGGYTTQFILYGGSVGQRSNGNLHFVGQSGQPLPLSIGY
jgi:hypothetical protein